MRRNLLCVLYDGGARKACEIPNPGALARVR
jgi:hypothetical protein